MPDEQVESILDRYPGARRDKLIPILQEIQSCHGYLNEETIKKVGKHLKLPTSKIYGIATFYNQFSFVPKGKNHIRICHGSSCHVNGGARLIKEVEKIASVDDVKWDGGAANITIIGKEMEESLILYCALQVKVE